MGESALARVVVRMASTLDLGEVLTEITRGLIEDLGAALARIWLLRDSEGERILHLAASAGLSTRVDGALGRVPVGSRKIGEIAKARAPMLTNELLADERIIDKAWASANGLVSFAGYPLVFRDELLGVLAVFARDPLGPEDVERLAMFAAHAAVAIKNAQLFDAVSALSRRLEAENAYLAGELRAPQAIVGTSPAMTRVLGELARVAPTSSSVLLRGETGTGKELFARAVHEQSPRRARPLIKVNCAAISPALLESELFGHEKGAFTGAVARRIGRFELADGGTLFLDEIGELQQDAQSKILRALQEREIDRVGGTKPVPVDVRIVCATNRDLAAEVRAGRFRADLYYRLNVFPIEVPPLRQRREDIPLLVDAFLGAAGDRFGHAVRAVDDDAMQLLVTYDWPGNVRELNNVLERAAILARGATLGIEDFAHLVDSRPHEAEAAAGAGGDASASLRARVDAYERTLIAEALRASAGNQSEAARQLRTTRQTLLYKIKTYGL